jgi:Family of unknown function (DUF6082)
MSEIFRHLRTTTTIVTASLAGLAAIVISPLALEAVSHIFNLNWTTLSNVGQAYGAVSALIAGFALFGIAASVYLQAREIRYNRWAGERARHFELMRMAIENPFYQNAFALPDIPKDAATMSGYINLLFYNWSMTYEFGDISERALRLLLSDVLYTDAGRAYWQRFGSGRQKLMDSPREIEFNQIADMIYHESLASATGATRNTNTSCSSHLSNRKRILFAFIAGAICGVLSNRAFDMNRGHR